MRYDVHVLEVLIYLEVLISKQFKGNKITSARFFFNTFFQASHTIHVLPAVDRLLKKVKI